MNHPVIDTRLDTCQSPARAPCTAQPSTTISQGFCCPNLNHAGGCMVQGAAASIFLYSWLLRSKCWDCRLLQEVVRMGGTRDTWHVAADQTQHPHPQLEEARDSWWRHVTAGSIALWGTWHATRVSRQTQQLVRGPQLGAVGLMRLLGRAFLFSRFHQLNQSERRKQSAWLHYLTTRKIIPNLPQEIINMYLKHEWVFYTIHWDI